MAKATIETVEVSPAVKAVTREDVTLTLSKDEARMLRALTGRCASGTLTDVYYALSNVVGTGGYRVKHKGEFDTYKTAGTIKVEKASPFGGSFL